MFGDDETDVADGAAEGLIGVDDVELNAIPVC